MVKGEMRKISWLLLIVLVASSVIYLSIQEEATGENEYGKGTWISKSPLPTPRLQMATVALDGKIYVIGGLSSELEPLATVDVYDPILDVWQSVEPMPAPKGIVAAVALNGKIYVVGDDNKTFCYDPETNTWEEKAEIPVPGVPERGQRYYGDVAAAAVNGKIYVAWSTGTITSPGDTFLYCYDPETDMWTEKAKRPVFRGIESFAVLDGKLYAIGGREPGHSPSEITAIDVYDPETNTWIVNAIPEMPTRRTHIGPLTPVINGRIYVIGGWDGYSALSTVEVYDPVTNTWSTETHMPTARYELGVAVINNRIYAIGGGSGPYFGSTVYDVNEEYTLPSTSTEEIIFQDDFESYKVGTLPSPPWEFWFNDIGEIVDTTYVSPFKCLRLFGQSGWDTQAIRRITSNARIVGYEVYVKVESVTSVHSVIVGFIIKTSETTSDWYADLHFQNGMIYADGGQPLQPYQQDTWYNIKVIYDREMNAYSVWINGTLKASLVKESRVDPYSLEGLGLASGHAEVYCFFDDVKVFALQKLDATPPTITILSPENMTYSTESVPLVFTVNEPISWIGYSLDNQANVTIMGNTTLNNLSEGLHQIIVYANDTYGNMGASQTVYFTVKFKRLRVTISGEHDYLPWENIKIRISALVADTETMELVSGANVTITIYDPNNSLWIKDVMKETQHSGIYIWESPQTVRQIFIRNGKGVYTVIVNASYNDGPTVSDILTFHIDPFPEETKQTIPLNLVIIITGTLTIATLLALLYIKKKRKPQTQ